MTEALGSPPQPGADLEAIIQEAIDSGKGWTEEERRAYIDSIPEDLPLFAETLDKVDPAFAEAMKALTEEDESAETLAAHFKELGNERFKRGRTNRMYYRHAVEMYDRAIGYGEKMDAGSDRQAALAALYANRSAAHLAIRNFGSALRDADASLALAPGNVKCFYRKARALLDLKRFSEALLACHQGLQVDAANKELAAVQRDCEESMAAKEGRDRERIARIRAEYGEIGRVWEHCASAGIQLGPSAFDERYHHCYGSALPTFEEDLESEADEKGVWRWPLLFLYPQHSQSDFVQQAAEADPIGLHLAQAFPLEGEPVAWDSRKEYRCDRLEMYAKLRARAPFASLRECVADWEKRKAQKEGEGSGGGASESAYAAEEELYGGSSGSGEEDCDYVHVDPACTLRKLLTCAGMVVAGALPSLLVFPRDGAAHKHFLKLHTDRITELQLYDEEF